MRSQQQVQDMILQKAFNDKRIRAVIMNGSRANKYAGSDIFQDYDIVYIVSELGSFLSNPDWIECFGEIMILQTPDNMGSQAKDFHEEFAYLMQFADGNRIDLTLVTFNSFMKRTKDSLSVLLLDKDGILDPFPPSSEDSYLPLPPTEKEFADCCNEFWWVATYVAKGLWREEMIYAKHMLDEVIRPQLLKALTWYFGFLTNFRANPGKLCKNLKQKIDPKLWKKLEDTYSDADISRTWDALEATCDLFRTLSIFIARQSGFIYPEKQDQNVSAHLRHVRSLAKDAKSIYE